MVFVCGIPRKSATASMVFVPGVFTSSIGSISSVSAGASTHWALSVVAAMEHFSQ